MTERDHKIKKTPGLKGSHLQCLHVSKEVPARHRYGEKPKPLSGESACWAASAKRPCTRAHHMGNKCNELQMCVQLQNCDLVGITEIRCDGCMTGALQWRDIRISGG